jgi:PAS domain S-box-containing protein
MATPSIPSHTVSDQLSLTRLSLAHPRRERHTPTFVDDHHALLDSIWENSSEPMRVADSEGIIVAANNAYCRMVGIQRDKLVGEPFTIVFNNSADRSRLLKKFCTRFSERNIEPVMNREVPLSNGKTIFVETTNSFIKGKDGQSYVLSIVRDVTARRQTEAVLQQKEFLLSQSQRLANIGSWGWDLKGPIEWTDETYRVYGLSKETFTPSVDSLITLVHPEDRPAMKLWLEACRAGQSPKPLEFRTVLPDASVRYISGTGDMIYDAENKPVYMAGTVQDITGRKLVEEALKESVRKYHNLIDNAVQGIFRSTADGRLLSANNALVRMLGYESFEELSSLNLEDLYVDPAARKALSAMLVEKGFCTDTELVLLRKDGTVITVVEHSRAVVDATGAVIEFEGMIDDITVRKSAEYSLRHERNLLRTLIDNLPDLIYFKDGKGRYILNNQAHLQSIGAANQESVLGKTSYYFHPGELGRQYQKDETAILNTGMPLIEKEELAVHKDTGKERWHLTSKIPLMNSEGRVTEIVGISRDITERKELEQRVRENFAALQSSREQLENMNGQKDRLMSVLSHDLRSPFTSILGFCEILLEDSETLTGAERAEFTTFIRDSARRQLNLLNELLDWSRLETGKAPFESREVDLRTVAGQCIQEHLGTAMKKGITLRSTLSREIIIRGDASKLARMFNNLISNALKFTPMGGTISIDEAEGIQHDWVLRVSDTGAGIPKDDLKRLFKVEERYTRRGLQGEEGTGLGLSLVDEILKKHSGSISVESEEGKGTTFIIRLPRLVKAEDQNVLVVDDDQGIRVLHSRYLKRMFPDAHVHQASDGIEALEMAKRYLPRLIVTDYSMPGMNGFELLNLLKQGETTKNIPVFVITGKESSNGTESLFLSGAAAVLTKPVSSKDLQERIEEVLKGTV